MSFLQLDHISFSYERDLPILKDISFCAEKGEKIGIVGANGAGKSTLLKILVGLNTGFDGSVSVGDLQLSSKNLADIRKQIGYVFQDSDSQLFMSTAYEDIAFGPRNYGFSEAQVSAMVENAMTLCGCNHLKDKQIYKMSGGEKKLISIATILALEPSVIIMDEPSVALDPKNRRGLINILKTIPALNLIASHDLDMIWEVCDRVILMDHGQLIADGPAHDILTQKELLESHSLELPLRALL